MVQRIALTVLVVHLCLVPYVAAQEQEPNSVAALKVKVAQAVRMLAGEGYVGSSGHVSARIPGTDTFLVNSRNASREVVQPQDIVTVDLDGNKVDGIDGEPDEVWMHIGVYRARPDVMSVVHTHALYSTAFTIAQKPILPVIVHGSIFADGVPEFPEAGKLITLEQGERLGKVLGPHRAALLRMHGAVVVGSYVEEAFIAALQLEENAEFQITASALGPVDQLTPEEVDEANRESWKPNSIAKRWQYYLEKLGDRSQSSSNY